jgi:hypothetical protein
MRKRKLGALEVSELGFGTLSFASTYGQAPEKAESIRSLRLQMCWASSRMYLRCSPLGAPRRLSPILARRCLCPLLTRCW